MVYFQVYQVEILIDSHSKINEMTPAFAAKLDLIPKTTKFNAQKIDSSLLETYNIISVRFSI